MKEAIKHELDKSEDKSWGNGNKDAKPVEKPSVRGKPGTKTVIPADGTKIPAVAGYWVLTASDADDGSGKVVFGRPRSVIAWIVGSDTATPPYPITARPFDPGIETVALVDIDGSVIGLDNVHYNSRDEWQKAVLDAKAAQPPPPPPAP